MNSRLSVILALSFSAATLLAAEAIDEKEFQKLMKEVGDTGRRLRTALESKDAAQLGKDAARVAEIHKQLASFWKNRQASDAQKWSDETSQAAAGLAAAVKADDWEKAKTQLQAYGKNCKSCHDAYREKLEDGSYKIKAK